VDAPAVVTHFFEADELVLETTAHVPADCRAKS
jgi:hypothetical protein